MGTFFTNLHVRTGDPGAVELALADADALPAYVTGADGGWVSVYPAATESQDLALLDGLGAALSGALDAPVLTFLVHDSDVFVYTLFEAGRAVDKYNSAPGYGGGEDRPVEGGDIPALLRHAPPGTSPEALRAVLHDQIAEAAAPEVRAQMDLLAGQMGGLAGGDLERLMGSLGGGGKEVFAERLAARLARLLGVPEGRSMVGFRSLESGQGPSDATLLEPA